MQQWYQGERYLLSYNGAYIVSNSYQTLLEGLVRLKESKLIWTRVMHSKHNIVVGLAE